MVSGTRMLGAASVELGGPIDHLAPNGRAPKTKGSNKQQPYSYTRCLSYYIMAFNSVAASAIVHSTYSSHGSSDFLSCGRSSKTRL